MKTNIKAFALRVAISMLTIATMADQRMSVAQAPNPLQAPQRATPIVLDGKLDDEAWKSALKMSGFKWLETRAEKWDPAQTEAHMLWDDEAVYVGIRCEEPKMAELVGQARERDGQIFMDDCVEVFLAPSGQTSTFYQFAVSAANVQLDSYYIEGGRIIGQEFNAVWESSVHKSEDHWSVEIRIPLSAFYFTPAESFSDRWLVNVTRERQPVVELTTWAPTKQRFGEPQNYITVGGLPRKSPAQDWRISSVSPLVTRMVGGVASGALQIGTSSNVNTAGQYSIRVEDLAGKILVDNRPVTLAAGEKSIVLENISYPSLGKTSFKVSLHTPQGAFVGGGIFGAEVVYQPLVVEMSEPFYANCIFPDQDVKKITGGARINLPPTDLRSAHLNVVLTGKDEVVRRNRIELKGRQTIEFALDAVGLAYGDYELSVEVLDGQKSLVRQALPLRKLAPPPGGYLYIDRHLNLVVDGKRTFPRTWMGDEEFMVTQALLDTVPHPNSKFVNLWKSLVNVEGFRLDTSPEDAVNRREGQKPSQKVFDAMLQIIEENRTRNTPWMYYLCDEPESNGVELGYLRHQYEFLKKHDPYHPVVIVSHSPENYVSVCDIVSPDSYLNPQVEEDGTRSMTPLSLVSSQQQISLQAGKRRTAVWFTPQTFSYSGWLGRLPKADFHTFQEYRCLIYTAIANGCKGILAFPYCDHFSSVDMRLGVDFIFESLARLEPFLVSVEPDIPVRADSPDNAVHVVAKSLNGQVVLIAVNTLGVPVKADISSGGLEKWKRLAGFREATVVEPRDGRFSLSFAPFEVHILSSQKLDADMRTVSEMSRAIADAKSALRKPGNILYGRGKEIEWDFSDTYVTTASSLYTLTDGITDALGWIDHGNGQNVMPARLEMAFPTFVPKFSKARVYTSTAQEMEFWIWKAGEWRKAGEAKDISTPVTEFDFGAQLTTVKIKVLITKTRPGMKAEIYELELYE